MDCPHCGQSHPDAASFCPATGRKIAVSRGKRSFAYLGILLAIGFLGIGLWLFRIIGGWPVDSSPSDVQNAISSSSSLETKTPTQHSSITAEPSLTTGPRTTDTPSPSATATVEITIPPTSAVVMDNFFACEELCLESGANSSRTFPEGTTIIYIRWDFENIPLGASYVRRWTMDDLEWVRYECLWPGPSSGIEELTLTEPDGLHSGTWEVTILIDEVVVLKEQIVVEGDWDYWYPAGVFDSCYGKL